MLNEARHLAHVSHPNIIPIFDVGLLDDDAVYLAMEYVEGASLRTLLDTRQVPTAVAIAYVLQADEGLAAAHGAGLVHRDVKPDNIWVGRDGMVRVLDFGLATSSTTAHSIKSETGSGFEGIEVTNPSELSKTSGSERATTVAADWLGTPAYMAPEQIRNEPCDARTDEFALACILIEIVTGKRPFCATPVERRLGEIESNTVEWPASASRLLRPILVRALAADPNERYETLQAFLRAVHRSVEWKANRWRTAVFFLASSLILVLALFFAMRSPAPVDRWCGDPSHGLNQEWNANIARSFAAVFEGVVAEVGKKNLEASAQAIENWSAAWMKSAASLCLDESLPTEVRRKAHEQRDHSWACLSESRAEFSALLEVWQRPTVKQVLEAENAVRSLSDPAECRDVEKLRSRPQLPLDPSLRQSVLNLRSQLKGATVFAEQSDFVRSQSTLTSLWSRIKATGDLDLIAEAKYLEATIAYLESAQDPRVLALVSQARLLAVAADRPRMQAKMLDRAWYLLVYASNQLEASPDLISEHKAVIASMGNPGDALTSLARERGIVAAMAGDFVRADQHLREALEFAKRDSDGVEVAWRLDDLGYCALLRTKFDVALDYNRQALAIRQRVFGPSHVDSLRSSSQMAMVLSRLSEPAQALAINSEALSACLHTWQDPTHCGGALLDLGWSEYEMGFGEAASQHFLSVAAIEQKEARRLQRTSPWSTSSMALVYAERGEFAEAYALAQEGVRKVRAEQRFHPRVLAIALAVLAQSALDLGRSSEAKKHGRN
jgi:serine/threonine-protein kinase